MIEPDDFSPHHKFAAQTTRSTRSSTHGTRYST